MREVPSNAAKPPIQDRFNWLLALYAAMAAVAISLGIDLLKSWDFVGFAYVLLVIPIISICVLGLAVFCAFRHRFRNGASLLIALVAFVGISLQMERYSSTLRAEMLWLLHSREYKTEVFAQPAPTNGALREIDWFGWGMFAQDTEMYLVYDPKNSLSQRNPATGKYGVLHCDVWRVQRLEDRWYSVTFYTSNVWEYPTDCDTGTSAP